ncbi:MULTISPECIES: hypothetical protein [unclassified Pantoea]|uniref:hypothetical protein n=1 Tax=unclassified Pantoea TaxID=2630326 RepID=UPI0001E0F7F1|nr:MULTISPECIES: hypothetical protein [unclassified Pantoea]EFM17933.1 hypothetical protein PanABDRAFT_3983 [Pantoea sp. aB]QNQ60179.1 hypothetical protein IAI47_08050 [Pantoea sp. MT58]
MSVSKDFLMSVYERCNEHIKEQSSKRDQTIAFYLVILSFYIGSYASFSKMISSQYSAIFLNLIICMIGGMTIRTLSGLRSWQMQYTDSALALNKILARDKLDFGDVNQSIKDFFQKQNQKYSNMDFEGMLKGIENRVIFCIILISGFPTAILVKEIFSLFKVNNDFLTASVKVLMYCTYILYYLYNTRKIIRRSANQPTWIVNFE